MAIINTHAKDTTMNLQQKILRLSIIAAAYFASAKIGLLFVVQPENIAGIWPASGVALAILLLHPRTMWSSILSTIFAVNTLANLTSGNSLLLSAGFAFANTLEPAFGAWCLLRLTNNEITLTGIKNVLSLIFVAFISNGITACIGASVPAFFFGAHYWSVWQIWWVEDGLGILIFTPLIISWSHLLDGKIEIHIQKIVEGVILLGLCFIFLLNISSENIYSRFSIFRPYMVFIFFIWAGLRYSIRASTLIQAIISILFVGYVLTNEHIFLDLGASRAEMVLIIQTYLAVMIVAGLITAGVVNNLRHIDQSLKESEKRYRTIVDHINDAFYVLDFQGNILDCNKNACTMLGYSMDELIHAHLSLIHGPVEGRLMQERMTFLKEHGVLIFDGQHRRKDGKMIFVSVSATVVSNAGGGRVQSFVRDISELKYNEDRIIQSEEDLRKAQQIAHVGNWKWFSRTGRVEMSDEMYRILGIDRTKFHGTIAELMSQSIHPDDLRKVEENVRLFINKKIPTSFETRIVLPDKTVKTIWLNAGEMVLDDEGIASILTGTVQDITERKKTEGVIRESEERFRKVFEDGPLGMAMADLNGGPFINVNNAFCEMLGYTEEELKQLTFGDVSHPDDRPREIDVLKRIREGLLRRQNIETRYIKKNGEIIWGMRSLTKVSNADGSSVYALAMIEDITLRKHTEEALQKSEALMRTAIENLPLIFYMIDSDGRFRLSIGAGLKGLGLEQNQVVGQSVFDIYKDSPEITNSISNSLSGQKVNFETHVAGSSYLNFCIPYDNISEGLSGVVAVALDITERKNAEEAMVRKTALLEAELNSTIEGVLVVDTFGKKILQNQRTVDLWKIPKHIADNVDDSTQVQHVMHMTKNPERFVEKIMYLYDHPTETSRDEVELIDGTILDRYSAPVVGKDGKNFGRIWTFHDITEHKKSEEELKLRESYLTAIIENQPGLVWLKDSESRFLAVNKTFAESCGKVSASELVGRTDLDIWPKDLAEKYREDDASVIRKNTSVVVVEPIVDRGETRWFETFKTPVIDVHGKIIGTTGFSRDISERKHAEESLKISEERLRITLEASQIGIWDWDIINDTWYASPIYYTMLGYEPEQGKADRSVWLKRAHPDDRSMIQEHVSNVLAKRSSDYHYDARILHVDGSYRWISVSGYVAERDASGNAIRLLGIRRDISEHKQAQSALLKNKKQYDDLASNISVGIYLLHSKPDGSLVFDYVSPRMGEILGVSAESILADSGVAFKHIHPEELETLRKLNEEHLKTKNPFNWEGRIVINEMVRWLHITSTPEPHENGIVLWNGVIEDITERKRSEEKLKISEELFRRMFNYSASGMVLVDTHFRFIQVNNAYCNWLGYTEQELIGKTFQDVTLPEDRAVGADLVHRVLSGEMETFQLEKRYLHKDGTVIWGLVSSSLIRDTMNKPLYFVTQVQDITERKYTEKALRESEARLKKAQHYGRIGSWTWNTKTNQLDWSDEMFRLFGLEKENFSGSLPDVIAKAIHPDDREKVNESNLSVINDKKSVPLEYRIIWPDQSIHTVWAEAGEMEFDDKGNIALLSGTVQDISERKQSQIELETSRDQLRKLAASLENIREEERKVIAREIHDELGQQLTGIKMNISLFQKKYGKETVLSEKLDYMKHLVDSGIQTVRNISKQLRPAVLDELGLIDAIKWQVREFMETTKIECLLRLPDTPITFRPEQTTGIFRIVQEALTNVVRHADAESAKVTFVQEGKSLYLSIEDDGKGITSSDLKDVDSIGLLGMHERAIALGGEMNILSVSPRGTKIEVRFPMEHS